jgi:undecaprenyl-diphosphatase
MTITGNLRLQVCPHERRVNVESVPSQRSLSSQRSLDPRPGGIAEHLADRAGDRPPLLTSAAVLVAGYVVVSAALLAIGLLLTKVLLDHGIGTFDSGITDWLVARRTSTLNDLTKYATYLANTEPVVAIAAVVTGLLVAFRRWREAIFLAASLAIELSVFLTVNYTVARPRPDVVRLNATPSTSSFPSGHSAASLVLWVGIAIIVAVLTTNVLLRVLSWLPVATLVWLVPFARVYRGMHHTTDVLAGLALGAAALGVGCLVARTWVAAMERRHARDEPAEPSRVPAAHMAGAGR